MHRLTAPWLLLAACASTDPAPSPPQTASAPPSASASGVSPSPSASASGMIDLGPSLGGGQVPLEAHFEIHLPGADAKRWLTATVKLGLGTESVIDGCVSSAAGTCRATDHQVLTGAHQAEYIALWKEVLALPRCEPLGRFPGDRAFRIEAGTRRYEEVLPAVVAELPARTKGVCEAPRRLAWWAGRRLGGL